MALLKGGDITAVIEPGLPNIQGSIPVILNGADYANEDITEAFSISSKRSYAYQNAAGSEWYKVNFNAADSNAIYSKSDTVQPPALVLIPQIRF